MFSPVISIKSSPRLKKTRFIFFNVPHCLDFKTIKNTGKNSCTQKIILQVLFQNVHLRILKATKKFEITSCIRRLLIK
jgi:hypothetical protein